MRTYDTRLDTIVDGTHGYRTQVRLDDGTTQVVLDVIEGWYRSSADRIPQHELDASIYIDDTPEVVDMLRVDNVRVEVSTFSTQPDGSDPVQVDLTDLWLQEVTRRVDATGTHYDIRAVDILGRLSENQLAAPFQPLDSTAADTIDDLLNGSGHHATVTVTGTATLAVDADVYEGDGAYAAVEVADRAGKMLRTTGHSTVTIIDPPYASSTPYELAAVTAYTTVLGRAPSKIRVQTQPSNGSDLDVVVAAGGAGSGDYGTVTRTVTRLLGETASTGTPDAAGLLRRVKGNGFRLVDVECLPFPPLEWGDTIKVGPGPAAVVWSVELPLHPAPMRLVMRDIEEDV